MTYDTLRQPKEVIDIWDNDGKTFDRYTIVLEKEKHEKFYPMLGLSHNPWHPQGFSQFGQGIRGPHLGRRIGWTSLSQKVREHILRRLYE